MDQFKYLVAKSNSEEGTWLPLWIHSLDTYYVMEYLLDNWLTESGLYSFSSRLSREELKQIALFVSLFHDFGKSSLVFQSKISSSSEDLKEMLVKNGVLVKPMNNPALRDYKDCPHSVAGESLLLIKECPPSIASIIGAHHGNPWDKGEKISGEIEDDLEEDGIDEVYRNFRFSLLLWGYKNQRQFWIDIQESFYSWAMDFLHIKSLDVLKDVVDTEAVLLTGLVIMADWLASNEEYFPLIPYDHDLSFDMENRIKQGIEKINLPPSWQPERILDPIRLSEKRFGFSPNAIQQEMINTVMKSENPGILILEAPMGVGKTEASLLAAEAFSKERVSGMFFALPTQATSNAIFTRVIDWGKEQSEENKLSIRLAHGMASLNENYRSLMDDGKHVSCNTDDYEKNNLIVHDFFRGSKQALLADFVVGTIDQVLLASLKQKHFMLRHLGLCGKVVIIDECHAYDAYMNEYLERTLQWLGKYRTPVILLSATLPYERRTSFIKAYLGNSKNTEGASWKKSIGYPLLTWTDGSNVHQKKLEYSGTHLEVKVDTNTRDIEQVCQLLNNQLMDGGCAGIFLNTVKRAQEYANRLEKEFPDKKVILLHSRFLAPERIQKEKELLEHLGKKSRKRERDNVILVGTQVIEQSLDFDVDLMITDLCPMDLLLQRMGRLHRHSIHNAERPILLNQAKCYVLGTGDNFEKDSVSIYGEYLLLRTQYFLKDQLRLPDDISEIVQKVYDEKYSLQPEPSRYQKAKDDERIKIAELKQDADAYRIKPPGNLKTINRLLDDNVISDDTHAQAQVRAGEQSMELLVLFQKGECLTRRPWICSDSYSVECCPNEEESRLIANERIRIPLWASKTVEEEMLQIPDSWNKSVWLRKQKLLILDEDGEKEINELLFHYSPEKGMIVERRRG
ncbi:MAG: CRISPR-associated helicase Cas3' [Bacillota bacterium]|nr:CRISPR-associated helicase Cas3' [Bacillota bacterium]